MPLMPPSASAAGDGRVLVITPTYNEIESLEPTLEKLFAHNPRVDVLIVDDASPDGTGELAERLASTDARVSVLHRSEKDGLGRAYLAGFSWAVGRGYPMVVEMDADGSHPAVSLPAMVEALDSDPECGVVIGSRWVSGGRVVDWPFARWLLSRTANVYARWALRIPVHDITGGYRVYRSSVVAGLDAEEIDSRGYCFQIDMTLRASDAGWRISEVPIAFREREAGSSKMNGAIVLEAMYKVTVWGFQRRFRRQRTGRRPETRTTTPDVNAGG